MPTMATFTQSVRERGNSKEKTASLESRHVDNCNLGKESSNHAVKKKRIAENTDPKNRPCFR